MSQERDCPRRGCKNKVQGWSGLCHDHYYTLSKREVEILCLLLRGDEFTPAPPSTGCEL